MDIERKRSLVNIGLLAVIFSSALGAAGVFESRIFNIVVVIIAVGTAYLVGRIWDEERRAGKGKKK